MNVLLIGSGGREHALAQCISKSKSLTELYASPGNPGIFTIAKNANINSDNFDEIIEFSLSKKIELVVIGPEIPLANGLADILRSKGINVFGPSKEASKLESSKAYAKDFMQKYSIPTANFRTFNQHQLDEAIDYLKNSTFPIVLKADGLAAGKGVIISENLSEATKTITDMFEGLFNSAGKTVVIEEFMDGEEASIFAITDGKDFITLAPSQDHKRVYDDDLGPNTGGMGAYAPAKIVTDEVLEIVNEKIIKPTLNGMINNGSPFIGCLYIGIMIKNGIPKVVEFNVRFGDPETQAVLPIFEGDFLGLLYSAAIGKLDKTLVINTSNGYACNVVLTSGGYPNDFTKGYEISGLDNDFQSMIYHSGTKLDQKKIVSNGGRVINVCGLGETLESAVQMAYRDIEHIHFKNMHYRKDIAAKELKRAN